MTTLVPERRRSNLPAEVTSFVGRRQELSQVREALERYRLVTLRGVGGVGKTRLALHLAADLQRSFADGVWLAELSALRNAELLTRTVAASLGLPDQAAGDPVDLLADYLAERHLLLILDTCEHLVDACAKLAEALLPAAPRLRILATSREPLGVRGKQAQLISPLGVPDSDEAAAGSDSVALFADRAEAMVPDDLRRRHRDYYLGLAEQAAAGSLGPGQVGWLVRLRQETPNLRVALDHSYTSPGQEAVGLRMTVLLRHYWLSLGLFTEGRRWHDRALAVGSDSPEAAWAVYGAGVLTLQQGDMEQAEPLLARAADLAQERHDRDLRAHVTDAQAIASFFAGGPRCHGDDGRGAGPVPAGAGAGQFGRHRGADLGAERVCLRPGVFRGRRLQPAGLADPQDRGDQGCRGGLHRVGATGRRPPAGPGGAGYRRPARVCGQDLVPVDQPAPGGPARPRGGETPRRSPSQDDPAGPGRAVWRDLRAGRRSAATLSCGTQRN